jgi:hypothetical protein
VGPVIVGVDIGQKVDPTAIAVAEQQWRVHQGQPDDHYVVRHLERLPLNTAYPDVAQRVREVVLGVLNLGAAAVSLFVDATGVGQPVVDLLVGTGVPVQACYFTYGDRRTVQQNRTISLGKAWLVSRLQALLQTGRILLPRTPEADALARELLDYELRVDQDANERYGAFRVGSHDDLVTALGLAVQEPPRCAHSTPAVGPAKWPLGHHLHTAVRSS